MDSPVVERMRPAGAIPIGRTNCPDMALRVHTDSGLFGLHPQPVAPRAHGGRILAAARRRRWRPACRRSASATTSAARCATRRRAAASRRSSPRTASCPATRPSRAADGPASFQLMPVEGPMARTVADVRLGLSVLAGRHRRDPYSCRWPRVRRRRGPPVARRPPRRAAGRGHRSRASRRRPAPPPMLSPTPATRSSTTPPPRFEEVIATWTDFIVADIRIMRGTDRPDDERGRHRLPRRHPRCPPAA